MLLKMIAVLITLLLSYGQIAGQVTDNWLYNNWDQLLETLLPMKPYSEGKYPDSTRWVVSIRIYKTFYDPIMITITRRYSGEIAAATIRPANNTLPDQVSQILQGNPASNVTDVANKIKMTYTKLSSSECNQLIKLADEYEQLSIHAVLPDMIIMGSTEYNILSQANYGNRIQILYNGPGSNALAQREPIIDWVERVRKLAIKNCK